MTDSSWAIALTRTVLAGYALNLAARVFAVPALIAIAGCAAPDPQTSCVRGVLYVANYRGGITPAIDLGGKPVPCENGR